MDISTPLLRVPAEKRSIQQRSPLLRDLEMAYIYDPAIMTFRKIWSSTQNVGFKRATVTGTVLTKHYGNEFGAQIDLNADYLTIGQSSVPTSVLVIDPPESFTWAAWVYLTKVTGTQWLVDGYEATGGGLAIFITGANIAFQQGQVDERLTTTGAPLVTGKWHHIACRFEKTGSGAGLQTIFVDGQIEAGPTSDAALVHQGGSQDLTIGGSEFGHGVGDMEKGAIAFMNVWKRPLSDSQIYALWHPRSRWDLYKQKTYRTFEATSPIRAVSVPKRRLHPKIGFRTGTGSTSNYLINTNVTYSSYPYVYSAWIRPDTLHDGAIIAQGRDSGTADYTYIGILSNGKAVAWGRSQSADLTSIQSTNTYKVGEWVHVCGVYRSNSDWSIYLDGKKATNSTALNSTPGLDNTTVGVLNRGGIFEDPFRGDIAEPSIYKVELSDIEVRALAKGKLPREVRGIVETWPMRTDANETGLVAQIVLTETGTMKQGVADFPPRSIRQHELISVSTSTPTLTTTPLTDLGYRIYNFGV